TCIAAATTPILLTGGFSPNHCDLHRIFANPTESQRAEITPPIFGQALRCGPKARLEGCSRGAEAIALRGSARSLSSGRPLRAGPVGAERLRVTGLTDPAHG